MSERELLAAAGRGDPAAQAQIFRTHAPAVYRALSRLSGADARDLDDLVQLAFVSAFRSAASFRDEAAVRSWILGVARNVARTHIRTEHRRQKVLDAAAAEPLSMPDSPSEVAERRLLLERVARAIAALPIEQREVLVLCDVSGVPGVEVAVLLGIPAGTVWRRLHEARKRVRRAVGEDHR
jgi:RNA polymerase sigma-70 factor (ECF subfamily)